MQVSKLNQEVVRTLASGKILQYLHFNLHDLLGVSSAIQTLYPLSNALVVQRVFLL